MWPRPETLALFGGLACWHGSSSPAAGQAAGCFWSPFLHPREKVFEGLLTNAHSALTLSRHPKKEEKEMWIVSAMSH